MVLLCGSDNLEIRLPVLFYSLKELKDKSFNIVVRIEKLGDKSQGSFDFC